MSSFENKIINLLIATTLLIDEWLCGHAKFAFILDYIALYEITLRTMPGYMHLLLIIALFGILRDYDNPCCLTSFCLFYCLFNQHLSYFQAYYSVAYYKISSAYHILATPN
jgi:hypothetical protein